MTVMAMPGARAAAPADPRTKNRSKHYWELIDRFTGRRRVHAAKDYIAAMLVGQNDEVLAAAVEAVERVVGVPHREEV